MMYQEMQIKTYGYTISVIPNLGFPDVLRLQLSEIHTRTARGKGYWGF